MIRTDRYDRACVLSIDGDLAGEDATTFRRAVEDAVTQSKTLDVIIDFDKSSFVDSAGLEALLWARGQCESAQKGFKLALLDEHCKKILEMTRLSSHFE